MQKHKMVKEILYTQEFLEEKILECSKWVNETYKYADDLVLVALLKGSIPFLAQLIKTVEVDHSLDFIIASSYAGSHATSGSVKIIMDLAQDVQGKDVLIVEDIIDSGITLEKIKNILLSRKPKSLRILTLMDKPYHRKNDLKADYSGFEVEDKFLIGFGLDYNEKLRNLPYIGVMDEKYIK
ncbi:hypoxanthine phosphoribosyltransferase [Mycoplasmopsis cynos]|uniref:hypoxanthine phosphoribosyltransferase n=1 Tax=Mycoplasmopsis cynos TaxID=171284 RepID=UPI002AFE62DA|nr:hypoxanthine phosphoribosyltransferase [Mycoplasmopsis cynos]WQQ13165.1 hypoxanthine phosphoribosyltransferase [Mycoplasmopsis cynos]WQQ13551.1 hypoxanthine phosphoribosyltransferase [Mycoplasmopsis cynos]WQQ18739.1 hypoxanthine phosphoribosyltransferase [Mycoplasmopsis cynos]WQQ18913.1 hypoxanthine phosphoribosyltransferase [Mycoplasmopsis cynos]